MLACREGLVDGTIDAIATDHAPHAVHEKDLEFTEAPPGLIGFETAFPVVLDLVRGGELSPLELMRRLSTNPARILKRPGGSLEVGAARGHRRSSTPKRVGSTTPQRAIRRVATRPGRVKALTGRAIATIVEGSARLRCRARCALSVSGKLPDPARLALSDGTVFRGHAFGARGVGAGEVVFNTSMAGYQEILSDPSYAGQIVVMTYTQIGNVGTNPEDDEAIRPFLRGFVVKEVFEPSNWRSRDSPRRLHETTRVFRVSRGSIPARSCGGFETAVRRSAC